MLEPPIAESSPREDCLIELQTAELPAQGLEALAQSFADQINLCLQKASLLFDKVNWLVTPRRLAVFIHALAATQPTQTVTRKGPAKHLAFDKTGALTTMGKGFEKASGVAAKNWITIQQASGEEWVGIKQTVGGESTIQLLPNILISALNQLPLRQRMRWRADPTIQFTRPIQSVLFLYGNHVVDTTVLGCQTGQSTISHRSLKEKQLFITSPQTYETRLETEGKVIADFNKRRELIKNQLQKAIQQLPYPGATLYHTAYFSRYKTIDSLLDEVTGLVEWPTVLTGRFDQTFLKLPQAVLVSAMQDHQRYFPIADKNGELLPYFMFVSNVPSQQVGRIISGNECVLRARLSDAVFFYTTDKKESLASRLNRLKQIVFQEKLGTLYAKTERIIALMDQLALQFNVEPNLAKRAAQLAKVDLSTLMVAEFPELQGVIGSDYAKHEGEPAPLCAALREQYLPRFAGDDLPTTPLGQLLGIVDRVDTLIGTFGIYQLPTGDKDPYGLRRTALGLLRLLIEPSLSLDLASLLTTSAQLYGASLENRQAADQVFQFIQERLHTWYHEKGIAPEVITAVTTLQLKNLLLIDQRIKALHSFKLLPEAEATVTAYKRVSHFLLKDPDAINRLSTQGAVINPAYFEHPIEQIVLQQLENKRMIIVQSCESGHYFAALQHLSDLSQTIEQFFEQVHMLTEAQQQRDNRLALLFKLQELFLMVADLSYL